GVPVVDLGGVDGHVAVALDGGADDAPGLPGVDDDVVGGVAGALAEAVFGVAGVADGVLVVDLVAAAGEQAALVHLDDVADALEHPLDAAAAARLAVLVEDGGDEDVLGADAVGGDDGADLDAAGVAVEVGVVAGADRLGVRLDDVLGGQQVGEVAGVLGDAEAAGAGRQQGQAEQRQQQSPGPYRPLHRVVSPNGQRAQPRVGRRLG